MFGRSVFALVLLVGIAGTDAFAQAPVIPDGKYAVAVADSLTWTQRAPTFYGRYNVSPGWTLDNIQIAFIYYAGGAQPISTTTATATTSGGVNFSNGFATAAPTNATMLTVKVTLTVWSMQLKPGGGLEKKEIKENYLFPAVGGPYTVPAAASNPPGGIVNP